MKYLFFRKVPYDYGAEYQQFVNGVRQRGIGAYEDGDAEILLELHGDKVEEITEQDYLAYKKKLNLGATSFRVFKTQPQDPSKDPNAVYASEESSPSTLPEADDLVEVGEAIVEDPLEGTE